MRRSRGQAQIIAPVMVVTLTSMSLHCICTAFVSPYDQSGRLQISETNLADSVQSSPEGIRKLRPSSQLPGTPDTASCAMRFVAGVMLGLVLGTLTTSSPALAAKPRFNALGMYEWDTKSVLETENILAGKAVEASIRSQEEPTGKKKKKNAGSIVTYAEPIEIDPELPWAERMRLGGLLEDEGSNFVPPDFSFDGLG